MSHKSCRLDSFCNNGFQSVEMNAYNKTEFRRYDTYLHEAFKCAEPTALLIALCLCPAD